MGEHEGPKKWLVASVRRRAAFRCPAEQGAIRWRLPMPIFLDIVDADAEGLRESRLGEARRNADAHRAGCQLEQRKAPGGVEPVEQRREIAHCAEPCRSEEHTSELQSLMRNSYAVFCLKKQKPKDP